MPDDEYNQSSLSWKSGYVYVIDYGDGKTFKIGYTTSEPQKRYTQIARGNVLMPMHLVFSAEITLGNARYIENALHMRFDSECIRGEWFRLTFQDLVDCYQVMQFFSFGSTKLYDRWFDLVPDDWSEHVERQTIGLDLPRFTRKDERAWNDFDIFAALGDLQGGDNGTE